MSAPATYVNSLLTTNRVAVLCDVNTATTDTDDDSLLVIQTDTGFVNLQDILFYKSPDEDIEPYTNVSGSIGEFWKARCGFRVKENCTIQNINITIQVQVLDGDGNESTFDLQTWNNPTSDLFNGRFTDIDIIQSQGFYLINESPFDIKSIQRDDTVDGGGYYGYELNYGFQLGYEWWQNLNDFAKQFETYRNQYWAVYSQNKVVDGDLIQIDGGSASIKFIVHWDILDNETNIVTEFERTCDVTVNDAEYTADITGEITTEDAVYGDDLDQQVASDVETTIVGIFTGTNIGVAAADMSVIGEMAIYYESGTFSRYDRICTGVDLLDDSLWIAQPTVTIIDPDTIEVSGTIDPTIATAHGQLAWGTTTHRLFVKFDYGDAGLHTDADIQIQTDGGDDIYVD